MEDSIKKFLSNLFMNRKLQLHILTLFLTLLLVSVICIIAFSYLRNEKSILNFSKVTIEMVNQNIQQQLTSNLIDLQQLPKLTQSLISDYHDITLENKDLTFFMLTALKTYPRLHAFFIATPDGNFIVAADLQMMGRNHYITDPTKPLPEGTEFALRNIDYPKKKETWRYMDASFKNLGEESLQTDFDPRTLRPYEGAVKTRTLYWSGTYVNPFGTRGIAVALPIYKEQKLIAVVTAVLPLQVVSDFFSNLKISKRGKAFIVDSSGKIIVPLKEQESSTLVTEAVDLFNQNHQPNYLVQDKGEIYLVHTSPFPVNLENSWLIVVMAPLNDFFGVLLQALRATMLISLILVLISSLIVFYLAKRISKPIVSLANEIDKIKHLNLESEKRVKSHIQEIILLDSSIASMRMVLRSFAHYVPKEIVKQLLEKEKEITLGGEKRTLTILFSDIIGFTTIAESLPIEIVMSSLEVYFDRLSKIILEGYGTIDKYIGDSIMAFWGAPIDIPTPDAFACQAALRCQATLTLFNEEQKKEGKPEFLTRIGIHTGEVIVGNIGTQERMNYTIIGDAVNEAARLEHINSLYHTNIVISEEVYQKIGDQFLTRPLDEVLIRGKKQKVKIYELIAKYGTDTEIAPKPGQEEICTLFSQAYNAYTLGKKSDAKDLFQSILQKFPHDFPTQLYLDRINIVD